MQRRRTMNTAHEGRDEGECRVRSDKKRGWKGKTMLKRAARKKKERKRWREGKEGRKRGHIGLAINASRPGRLACGLLCAACCCS